jgi:ATP-dependent DNA helicase RecG
VSEPGAQEHQLVEWKQSWRDDYLRWLCGFANANGGTLVIGKDDHGKVVGAPNAQRLLEEIPNKARDLLGIVVGVELREEQPDPEQPPKQTLEITVESSPTPISYRGEYHIRSGSTKQQLTGTALSAFLLRKFGRHWDGAPVPGVTVEDLDPLAFKRFAKHAKSGQRMPADALSVSSEELLERLHLKEAGMLKRAALLLFHEDAERWFTGAYVKVGRFRTHSQLLYHDEFHGDLFHQLDQCVETLLTKYLIAWITYEGLQRVETYPVPRAALREAVINALIHKDYTSGAPIQISVYANRLMIWNPGQLPADWSPERLLTKHPSKPQNPDLAQVFFRTGLIEAWGRGYERIMDACCEAGTPLPTVRHDGAGLWIEWEWVPPDEATDPVTPQVAGRVTGQVEHPQVFGNAGRPGDATGQVTGEVTLPELESQLESQLESDSLSERVLATLKGGALGKAAISAGLGQKQVSGPPHGVVRQLVDAGLITMTLPDKPNSRLQKYRLTDAGKALLRGRGKA